AIFPCNNKYTLFMLVFPASELSAACTDMPSVFCPEHIVVDSDSLQEFYYLLCLIKVFESIFRNDRKLGIKDVTSKAYEGWVSSCCDCRADCIAAFLGIDFLAPVSLRLWWVGSSSTSCLRNSCSSAAVCKPWYLGNSTS